VSPKIVDKEAKKKQIVHAAIAVFARTGINSAKMADIAEAAGVGKGTIYEYFRSKDEVFAEAFNFFQEEIEAAVGRRIWRLQDPEGKLRAVIQAFVEISQQNTDFIEIMFDFWAEGIRTRHETVDLKSVYDKYRQDIASFMDEGVRTGVFRPVNSALVASAILAAMDGLALQWFVDKEAFSLAEAGEELAETMLRGIKA